MVPNIPPQEASNRLQIFQVKLCFLVISKTTFFVTHLALSSDDLKMLLEKNVCALPKMEMLMLKVDTDFNCILIC